MNIRSLTRGDGAVILAAVVLLIASFLTFYTSDSCGSGSGGEAQICSMSAWEAQFFPLLPSVFLAGLIAAGLLVTARLRAPRRRFAGLAIDQWGVALAVFAAWSALWTLFGGGEGLLGGAEVAGPGTGSVLGFFAALALAAAAVLGPRVPALKAPLIPAGRPGSRPQGQVSQSYGGQQGYGYPGTQEQSHGYPGGEQQNHGAQSQYGRSRGASAGPAGDADHGFQPFWFAVPVARPLYGEDGASPVPVGELTPGTWYLAVDQRGQALIAQTQDGRRGLLQDTTGIQRG